jgi:hypothetical protein
MPNTSHHAVQTVHECAAAVLTHERAAAPGPFWRRWFDNPSERPFADEVRAFLVALDYVLDVPPTMLSRSELAAIGEDVERVAKRIEAEIESPAGSTTQAAASLTPAIYAIRVRYEELYKRGASKPD